MRITTTFFFILVLISSLNAANYYVNNVIGNDNNSGLTPDLPIQTIAKLNTKTLAPGDNVFFARGSVWKEQFNLNYSGTASSPISIADYGTGNLPQIDCETIRANGIYIYGRSYINIKNINVINQGSVGAIRVKSCSNVTVDSCVFYVTNQGGVFIENSTNCMISHNRITTPSDSYPTQTDGIYSQRNSNITFDGNNILITNQQVDQHIDGIQSYLDTTLTFCNNIIEQRNTKTYNAQGIYCTTGSGNFIAYNNIIKCPNTQSSTLAVDNLSTGTASAEVYNNTLINGGYNCLMVNVTSVKTKNNIFSSTGNYAVIDIASPVTPSDFNYNIYLNTGSSTTNMVYYQGSNKTMSQWKAMGCEVNGKYSNPGLNSDGSINSNSSAVDAGVEIGSTYDYDVNGTPRPQLNGIDIGAFEYSNTLPVELVSFTGNVSGSNVLLQWRTATEVNNFGFDIEKNLGNGWSKIGFVAGAGNSSSYKDYSFTDKPSGAVSYRLKQIDVSGGYKYSNIVEVTGLPESYSVSQNYPNPFNPSTTIKYSLPQNSFVNITIYNIAGEKVSSLLNEFKEAGSYDISWNAKDMASGVYLVNIKATGSKGEILFSRIVKMNLLK